MQTYRFDTRISKDGIIQLAYNQQLMGREVEIIIMPKEDLKPGKNTVSEFIDKWAGFLSVENNVEESKFHYLTEKYK